MAHGPKYVEDTMKECQNSINLASMEPDRCWITGHSGFSDGTYCDLISYRQYFVTAPTLGLHKYSGKIPFGDLLHLLV
jgi:hypothetical protein